MFFDIWMMIFMAPAMLLAMWASWRVQANFQRFSQVPTMNGITGAQAAQIILERTGIHDVRIIPVPGALTDHYNPTTKELALSEPVYQSTSIAAVGVAAHECGHAMQHATGYAPMFWRASIVALTAPASNIGQMMILVGFMFLGGSPGLGRTLVGIGALLFSTVLLFQLVTLPVEFDATARAKRVVVELGLVYPEERWQMDRVLGAAALTYVAAAIQTGMQILYFLWRAGLLDALLGGRRRRDDY
jgi:hypothetical protein